jgi:hypothetical protein
MFLEEMRYAGWDENAVVVVVVGETPMINQCQSQELKCRNFLLSPQENDRNDHRSAFIDVSHPFSRFSLSSSRFPFPGL